MKQQLSFYTNIPTPYQLDFFAALSENFDLHVIFYASSESNRQWTLKMDDLPYKVTILSDAGLIKPLLKFDHSFHFSWKICKTIWNDPAPFIIVGGTYHAPNVMLTLLIATWRKKKSAFFSEKIPPTSSPLKKFIKQLFLLPIKFWADYLIAVSSDVAASYQFYGIKLPQIVIPYNINNQLFNKNVLNPLTLQQLQQTLKPNNEKIILSSGALIYRKGMDIVINAFLLLPPELQHQNKLIILGDGIEKDALNKLTKGHPNIILAGFKEKEEIPYYFALADIFIFASRYDGWALVINEAFAAGLPVIASITTGAAREWIKDETNGYLVHEPSPEQYAFFLEKLIKNNELCKKISSNNIQKAKECSSQQLAQNLAAFIAEKL